MISLFQKYKSIYKIINQQLCHQNVSLTNIILYSGNVSISIKQYLLYKSILILTYSLFKLFRNSKMKLIQLILITILLVSPVISSIDTLAYMSSDIVTATGLTSGSKDFTVTFNTAMDSTPTIAYALFAFSSANFQRYAIQVSTSGLLKTGLTFTIVLNQNLWTSLSYIILSSTADNVVLSAFTFTNLGLSSSTIPTIKSHSFSEFSYSGGQDRVKFDVFIVGFDIQLASSTSEFYLNAAINYGDADKTNSLYSTYNDYVYPIIAWQLPTGISVTRNSLSLALSWIGTLTSLQLTYISHPVNIPATRDQSTAGFNTLAVTSKSNLLNITLLNPTNNKNNLGSLNVVSFYGFTGIGLTPGTTLDAIITLKYSYFVNLTTGSTIDFLNTSYYFYQPFANSIVDYLFNQLVPITFDSKIGTATIASSTLSSYYTVILTTGGINSMAESFKLVGGKTYQLLIQALDLQGCWSDHSLVLYSISAFFTGVSGVLQMSNNNNQFIVNPKGGCVNQSATQFATPKQNMFKVFSVQRNTFQGSNQNAQLLISSSDTRGTIYFKNIKVFLMSPNQFLDPNYSESSINVMQTVYASKGNVSFYRSITATNAIIAYVNKNNPVTITFTTASLTQGTNYTLSFYILDSVGNIPNLFSSPTIQVDSIVVAENPISIVTASLSKPFCNSNFNSSKPLIDPVDQFYLPLKVYYTPTTTADGTLTIIISDQDTSDHMYAIRGISLRKIQYFNAATRAKLISGAQCPTNTYLATNVQPHSCQGCDAQGKIDSGSGCICSNMMYLNSNGLCNICKYPCINCQQKATKCTECPPERILNLQLNTCNCPIGKYEDTNLQCQTCNYACASCQLSATHCIGCITTRILNPQLNTCNCLVGKYDDGINSQCSTCSYSCMSCVQNPTNCTSCSIERTLNSKSNTCNCLVGKYDDGINSQCGTCNLNCVSCQKSATHCISCLSVSTLDNATFTCKCIIGYTISSTGVCIQNSNPIPVVPTQSPKSFSLKSFLSTANKSSLPSTCIANCTSISILNSKRMLTSTSLTLLNVNFFPNNIVEFVIQNPDTNLNNIIIVISINNTNIDQPFFQFKVDHLYSSNTMTSIYQSSDDVATQVLLSILLFVMLIFYVFGDNLYHNINFIQKLSFLRFNLDIMPSIFSFLYGLRYSYQCLRQECTPKQNSKGNYSFVDKDANILRNVGIPIVFSITIIIFKIIGLGIFRNKMDEETEIKRFTFKKFYYRTIEYIERTIMFPIIYFSIAEITFSNLNFTSDNADPSIFNTSFAFSIIYIIYFAIVSIITFYFHPDISKEAKLLLIGEYLFNVIDSVIIIQTYNTPNILTLILTIVARCSYEFSLKYLYGTFIKLDLIKLIIMVLQIALIGILGNNVASLSSIQALFACIIIINLIYAMGKIIIIYMGKKQNNLGEQTGGNSQVQAPAITDSAQIINCSAKQ